MAWCCFRFLALLRPLASTLFLTVFSHFFQLDLAALSLLRSWLQILLQFRHELQEFFVVVHDVIVSVAIRGGDADASGLSADEGQLCGPASGGPLGARSRYTDQFLMGF